MSYYYLLQELPDERLTVVNEKYAPKFGMSTSFTPEEAAELMGVKLITAKRRIESWIYDGYLREVI